MKRVLLSVTVLLAGPRLALSQELAQSAPRQGYYATVDLVGFSAHTEDHKRHRTDTLGGYGLSFAGGEMVNEWLGLGLRYDSGAAQNSREKDGLAGLSVEAQLALPCSLAVHGGAGVGAWVAVDRPVRKSSETRGVAGAYYSAGVTYDWFVTRAARSGGIALTPGVYVKYLPGSSYNSLVFWGGIGVSFWSGLDAQALALPPSPDTAAP